VGAPQQKPEPEIKTKKHTGKMCDQLLFAGKKHNPLADRKFESVQKERRRGRASGGCWWRVSTKMKT